jgi:heme-degrading monooxygenase HmoA
MSPLSSTVAPPVFKIDRFAVPHASLPAFIKRLRWIDKILGTLPGCRTNLVLTQATDSAEFNVITIAKWANAQEFAQVKAAIQQRYADDDFDPAAYMQTLGVRADMGLYADA